MELTDYFLSADGSGFLAANLDKFGFLGEDMAARVTSDDVLIILPSSHSLSIPQINMAIDSANCLVNLLPQTNPCLKQIELYLSAHFAAVSDFTLSLKSEKDGCSESSATYGFELGVGIMGSPFGQMANTLAGGELVAYEQPDLSFYALAER